MTMPFGHRDPSDRVATYCDECGQTDDHPKHHVYDPTDGRFESHHHDCGATSGCAVCAESEALTGGKRGAELVAAITNKNGTANARHAAALAEAVGADVEG